MLTSKEFVQKLVQDNEGLFRSSELMVKAYFDSKPSQEELVEHFVGRMVNERMNMVGVARAVVAADANTDPEELTLLSKQVLDEAVHFKLVKEVIEHITGEEVDVDSAIAAEKAKPTAKGASLLSKYGQLDDVVLSTYQLIAEGRAERNWDMMANCIPDEFISSRYARIAKDEGFHATIGARKLEKLCGDEATQERVLSLAHQMRQDLYEVCCANSMPTEESRKVFEEAYLQ
jgi:rubrerythrin